MVSRRLLRRRRLWRIDMAQRLVHLELAPDYLSARRRVALDLIRQQPFFGGTNGR